MNYVWQIPCKILIIKLKSLQFEKIVFFINLDDILLTKHTLKKNVRKNDFKDILP